jgi:hypothetical protein
MRKSIVFLFAFIFGIFVTPNSSDKVIAQDCGDCHPQFCDGGLIWDCSAGVCIQPGSPIIIDLKDNGYDLTDPAHGVRFDISGDSKPRQWSWTARGADEAFLVLDRDGDGLITSGLELFGNFTEQPVTEEPNGFIALGVFDINDDHWIDANDAIYQQLQLWIDSNHDGVSQRRELSSLGVKGVEGIACDYRLSKRSDRHGNRFRYKALARINGTERWVWDIFFLPGK